MYNQTEKTSCPVCGKHFNENDDVVFCPECGTPHHRECYLSLGHCANEDKHAEGYSYAAAPGSSKTEQTEEKNGATEKGGICPACGYENGEGKLFCEQCGTQLGNSQQSPYGQNPYSQNGVPQGVFAPVSMEEIVSQIMPPDEKIDDIPAKDWAIYIGNSAPYYLYQFKKQDMPQKRGLSFTWSALIMPVLYFLYRRMWGIAAIAAVVFFGLNVPSAMAFLAESGYIELGTSLATLNDIGYYCSLASILISVLCAFFAVTLFRKSAGKRIRKLRAKAASETEYYQKLRRLSGPSKILLVILLIWLLVPAALLMFYSFTGV